MMMMMMVEEKKKTLLSNGTSHTNRQLTFRTAANNQIIVH